MGTATVTQPTIRAITRDISPAITATMDPVITAGTIRTSVLLLALLVTERRAPPVWLA